MVLLNALLPHTAEQGWVDRDFIDDHTGTLATDVAEGDPAGMLPRRSSIDGQPAPLTTFDAALERNRTTLEQAAGVTGLSGRASAARPSGSPSPRRTARVGARCSPARRG